MNFLYRNLDFLLEQTNTSRKTLIKEFDLGFYEVKNLLSDKAYPSPDTLIKISEYFDVSIDDLLKKDLAAQQSKPQQVLRFLVLDVDGVMTDGGMYYSENGDEIKKFNVKDGMAITELLKRGIKVGFMSSGTNKKLVKRRADLFGVKQVYVGTQRKIEVMKKWCAELAIDMQETAYIGDDINDRELMEQVGVSACPANAVLGIKRISNVVLKHKGGDACVREFAEEYLFNENAPFNQLTPSANNTPHDA